MRTVLLVRFHIDAPASGQPRVWLIRPHQYLRQITSRQVEYVKQVHLFCRIARSQDAQISHRHSGIKTTASCLPTPAPGLSRCLPQTFYPADTRRNNTDSQNQNAPAAKFAAINKYPAHAARASGSLAHASMSILPKPCDTATNETKSFGSCNL
jgi:hypothetical protein